MLIYEIVERGETTPTGWAGRDGDAIDFAKNLMRSTKGKRTKKWQPSSKKISIFRYTVPAPITSQILVSAKNDGTDWYTHKQLYAEVFVDPDADLESEKPPTILVKVKT